MRRKPHDPLPAAAHKALLTTTALLPGILLLTATPPAAAQTQQGSGTPVTATVQPSNPASAPASTPGTMKDTSSKDDVWDYVSLYYVTSSDLPRLLKVLRPDATLTGGDPTYTVDKANQDHTTLLSDAAAEDEARQAVNNARAALLLKQNAAADAERKLKDAQTASDQTSGQQDQKLTAARKQVRTLTDQQTRLQAIIDNDSAAVTADTGPLDDAKSAVTADTSSLQADPDNAELKSQLARDRKLVATRQAKLDRDTAARDRDNQQMTTLKANLKVATDDLADVQQNPPKAVTDAQTALNAATTAETSAQNALAAAQTAEASANGTLARDRATVAAQALVDNRSFALARDNAPYYFADKGSASPAAAPLQQVALYGFPDTKRIYIRGPKDEVRQAKAIIAQFDRPSTQALMTLWTMEISSQGDDRGNRATEKALGIIRRHLSMASQLMDNTMDVVRSGSLAAVYEAASAAASAAKKSSDGSQATSAADQTVTIKTFHEGRPVDSVTVAFADLQKQFYDPDILRAFAISGDGAPTDADKVLLSYLPDPTRVSTPAEALVVLSLANDEYEQHARENIVGEIGRLLPLAGVASPQTPPAAVGAIGQHFRRLRWWLGSPGIDSPSGTAQSSMVTYLRKGAGAYDFSKELSYQIRQQAESRLERDLDQRIAGYRYLLTFQRQRDPQRGNAGLQKQVADAAAALGTLATAATQFEAVNPSSRLYAKAQFLQMLLSDPKSGPDDFAPGGPPPQAPNGGGVKDADGVWPLAVGEYYGPSNPEALAREAAVNETLKATLKAINDDFQDEYIEPMFEAIRGELQSQKDRVAVGVFQRTSILASNRFVARVDPNASANLELGQQSTPLADLQQLIGLAGTVIGNSAGGAVNAAVAGALPGVATAAVENPIAYLRPGAPGTAAPNAPAGGSTIARAGADLEALDRLPSRTTPPGVYGVTTGNTFQVTPIVDPSGQAMSFSFDHVLTTPIREPDGTINTALPRIERHGVNTQVQLTNNEIRTVSQFDSNVQLGLPNRYYGGVPVVKDWFPHVPILGYFSKSSGHAGSVQQSLLLAQATMLPTIGDVINLLTEQNNGSGAVPLAPPVFSRAPGGNNSPPRITVPPQKDRPAPQHSGKTGAAKTSTTKKGK